MAQIRKNSRKKTVNLGLSQAPSLEDMEAQNPGGDLNVNVNDDGSVTVDLDYEDSSGSEGSDASEGYDPATDPHYDNLVDTIDEDELERLGQMVLANVQSDETEREEWMKTIEMGLELLGIKVEEKNEPFEGACSAQHPLLMESAVKFQSKASNELLPADGPVKTKILGDNTIEKEQQANRVKAHMNFQITEEMTEFYTDSERMLLYVPIVGSGFKKTYYNAHLERPVSEFVPADQFLVPNTASDLYRASRYTHILFKNEYDFEADCSAGLYKKPEDGLDAPEEAKYSVAQKKAAELMGMEYNLSDATKSYTFYEQHIVCSIEGIDEYEGKKEWDLASPYIITVDSHSGKVVGLRRNWKKDDVKRKKKVQFTHFTFVPSFGFYGFGFLHLLGNLQLSLTAALRALVDAGQFANLQGGFKLKGVRIIDDGSPIQPGQFKEIEAAMTDINKAIMPLPFKGADQTLFGMLQFLDEKASKFADSTEAVVADSAGYGPVGTTMALLDASQKMFGAIHKRLHNSLKHELRLIAKINAETLQDDIEYNQDNETMAVTREDYNSLVDIVPVSDPNISSNAHRMAKAQALLTMASQNPEIHDMREIYKHVYTNMDYANIDKILPPPASAQPQDPITDLNSAVAGKPIQAFPGQDHQSYITIMQAFLNDPATGRNPAMQKPALAIQAYMQQHMIMMFTEQVQAQAQQTQQQAPMQGGQQPASPEAATAQAAQQVAQMHLQQAQAQAQQSQAQPAKDQAALMLAQSEAQDTQTKARKQQFDEVVKQAELQLKQQALKLDKLKVMGKFAEADRRMEHELEMMKVDHGLTAMADGLSQPLHHEPKPKDTKPAPKKGK